MTLRVAVVGSGPAGSSAAETLAKAGIETYLFERKLDNAKPCGGAIPLCMVGEFDLPPHIIDRRVRKMKMISPSNREVDINLIKEEEYIGMCRREVLDGFMRDRAAQLGANLINATVHKLDIPKNNTDPYTIHYVDHTEGGAQGIAKTLKVDIVIGADGANSRIAKEID
ncbi:MAG: FAD-dependent monooxygenase, partial [Chroococcidiopsidaceae cyanobacterium CP_BM_RX_35]|nr:FAD-dependent monooxygenase [Chroococcidiopsidaceae cyanobacterium CP_BM_RX_35]